MAKTKRPRKKPAEQAKPALDFSVTDHGSVVIVTPRTAEAKAWVDENVVIEGWQWWGGGFAVDHHQMDGLAQGIEDAGFSIAAG